jgi:hypothetical protein
VDAVLRLGRLPFRNDSPFRARAGDEQPGALRRRTSRNGQQHQAPEREGADEKAGKGACAHGLHQPERAKALCALMLRTGSLLMAGNDA